METNAEVVEKAAAVWQTVANKTFRGAAVGRELAGPFKNRRYTNCTFQDYAGPSLLHGRLGSGIEFVNCKFKRLKATKDTHGTLLFFPGDSKATSRDDYGLKFINCQFEECEGSDLFEFKCSGSQVINCSFVRCKGGARIRHGSGTRIINCTGLPKIKARCGPHVIANCPGADVVAYAGNLPGVGWEDQHIPGGGHNMQCAYRVQIANVKRAFLGYHFGENDKKYPATECNIAPGTPFEKILAKGTTYNPVPV